MEHMPLSFVTCKYTLAYTHTKMDIKNAWKKIIDHMFL